MFPSIWEAACVLGNAVVLAHQGGWDEALMVIVPVGLFVGLLWVAYRRQQAADGAGAAGDDEQGRP